MDKLDTLVAALGNCLDIMAYYHKTPYEGEDGHLDTCDCPEVCGHCIAVKAAVDAIRSVDSEMARKVLNFVPRRMARIGC